jgi:hypothetical protein
MKDKTLVIAITAALVTGLASFDAVAGKGGGGGGGGSGGGGMPSMGNMGGGGMSKGPGTAPVSGMQGMSGKGGNEYKGQGIDSQSRERIRIGEKDEGVRTRSADQAW